MKLTNLAKMAVGVAMLQSVAQSATFDFIAILNGASEEPPVVTPGLGTAHIRYDDVAGSFTIEVDFLNLIGTTTAAHIHAPTAVPGAGNVGVAHALLNFPTGVNFGTYSTVDAAISPVGQAALLASFNAGTAYVNIHTTAFPGGEIRGFLAPTTPVPDSSTLAVEALMVVGALGLLRARKS